MTARAIGAGAVAALLTAIAMPLMLPYLRHLLRVDTPNERSSHVSATPRGGGAALVIGVVIAMVVFGRHDRRTWAITVILLATALVGLLDDIRPLGAKRRLAAQLLLGLATLVWFLHGAVAPSPSVVVAVIAVVAFAAYVNAFNFMDGINGISGIQAAVAGTLFAVLGVQREVRDLAVLGAVLAGAGLAFLPFNLRRQPMVFLGDVGSYLLGAGLVSSAVLAWKDGATIEASIAPLAIYFADTGSTILRRLCRGDDVFSAHREHVYQQLTPSGTPHGRTAVLVGVATAVIGGLGLASETLGAAGRVWVGCAAAMVVLIYLALPRITTIRWSPSGQHAR